MAGKNDLDGILCGNEQRSVSRQLVVNYNRMKFMLRPDKTSAAMAGKLSAKCRRRESIGQREDGWIPIWKPANAAVAGAAAVPCGAPALERASSENQSDPSVPESATNFRS
jgi:hypothetical protein